MRRALWHTSGKEHLPQKGSGDPKPERTHHRKLLLLY